MPGESCAPVGDALGPRILHWICQPQRRQGGGPAPPVGACGMACWWSEMGSWGKSWGCASGAFRPRKQNCALNWVLSAQARAGDSGLKQTPLLGRSRGRWWENKTQAYLPLQPFEHNDTYGSFSLCYMGPGFEESGACHFKGTYLSTLKPSWLQCNDNKW